VLESKAARLEAAVRIATECKRRYADAVQTIDGLRLDNHTLRVALAALSGTSVDVPAPSGKADELIAALPEIPQVTTQEEESILQGAQSQLSQGAQNLDSLSTIAAAAAAAGQEEKSASAPVSLPPVPSAQPAAGENSTQEAEVATPPTQPAASQSA
jgi:hypothetical protein